MDNLLLLITDLMCTNFVYLRESNYFYELIIRIKNLNNNFHYEFYL